MILARFADHTSEPLAILRVTIHHPTSGLSTLLANVCPFSGCGEFARFMKDFAESVGKSIEATAKGSVWHGATKHFERVLSSAQRIEHSDEAGTQFTSIHLLALIHKIGR